MEESGEETRASSIPAGCSAAGEGGDVCRQNGLINTHRPGPEPQRALLLVYSAPQYHSRVLVNGPVQPERSGRREGGAPQLLNPGALLPQHASPDRCLRPPPGFFLCPESVLRAWGEGGGGDCCETTFIEGPDASSSCLLADGSFFCGDDTKVHALSYDVDDDDDLQELEVGLPLNACRRHHHRHLPAFLYHNLHHPLSIFVITPFASSCRQINKRQLLMTHLA